MSNLAPRSWFTHTDPNGSVARGTNPRAKGTNPRALGTNPKALRALGIEPGTPEAKAHIEAVKLAAMKRRIGLR